MLPQFTRQQNTPVLERGSTYDGWVAYAIAAPSVCYNDDDEIYVMVVSLWDDVRGKWATAFFTSIDQGKSDPWTYVSGSLIEPSGSNYILGNGGIEYFLGEYWISFSQYIGPGADTGVEISHSSDLLTWTDLGEIIPTTVGEDTVYQTDSTLRYNPHNGLLECWYIGGNNRKALMSDTSDGINWTARGVFLDGAFPYETDFGEIEVFYPSGSTARYLLHDGSLVAGERFIWLEVSENRDTTWVNYGTIIGPSQVNSYENVNVFDSACLGAVNLGDGLRIYLLYAGADIAASTDDTNSSIGLAYIDWDGGSQAFIDNTRNVLHNILGMVG